jgi:phytoene synthase
LGQALQLTNILRDLDEDAAKGRLYLPLEALLAAGIKQTDPAKVLDHPALDVACGSVVAVARSCFANAREVMAHQARRTVRAPRLMAKVYQNILKRLVARGWAPPRRTIHVGRGRLVWIVLRDGLFPVGNG